MTRRIVARRRRHDDEAAALSILLLGGILMLAFASPAAGQAKATGTPVVTTVPASTQETFRTQVRPTWMDGKPR